MKTLERCKWRHSSVFIVNREHISSFVLIVEFEHGNVCWIHIEIQILLEARSGILRAMLQYFQCEQNLVTYNI